MSSVPPSSPGFCHDSVTVSPVDRSTRRCAGGSGRSRPRTRAGSLCPTRLTATTSTNGTWDCGGRPRSAKLVALGATAEMTSSPSTV